MVKKTIVIGLGVVVAVAVVWLARASHRREWTTSVPEAQAQLELGLAAQAKVYHAESLEHFSAAVRLDPTFVAAKVFMLISEDKSAWDKRKELLAELRRVDVTPLTPRERFLVRYNVANFDRQQEDAQRILRDYLEAAPDDPFALNSKGQLALAEQDWSTAQRVFERLVEVAPNRVEAYNELGYLAMAQERFQDSENMFRTYRYLAPDQANPRDSLGELLALTGRYEEAEREFYGALATRPDFCVSYEHLVSMSMLDQNVERVEQALTHATQSGRCSAEMLRQLACRAQLVRAVASGDWDGIWQAGLDTCAGSQASADVLRFWAAVRTGRGAEVDAWEAKFRDMLAKPGAGSYAERWLGLQLAHLEGVRLLAAGDDTRAAARLAAADQSLAFRGLADGMFKLLNRAAWLVALQQAGDRDRADHLAKDLSRVNPGLLKVWRPLIQPDSPG